MSHRRGARADQGSGVVLVLAGAAVLVLIAAVIAGAGVAAAVRHRAAAAADLAALAAAAEPPGCDHAAEAAHAAGGELAGCWSLGDGTVLVETEVGLPAWLLPWVAGHRAAARARAGRLPVQSRPTAEVSSGGWMEKAEMVRKAGGPQARRVRGPPFIVRSGSSGPQ